MRESGKFSNMSKNTNISSNDKTTVAVVVVNGIADDVDDDLNNSKATIIEKSTDSNEDNDFDLESTDLSDGSNRVKSIIEKFNKSNQMKLMNPQKLPSLVPTTPPPLLQRTIIGVVDVPKSNGFVNHDEDDVDRAVEEHQQSIKPDEPVLDELQLRCRNLADEYCRMEERQAKLCIAIAHKVYKKIDEENRQQKMCEQDDLVKAFYCFIETEKLAQLIHNQIALEIRERLNNWHREPYFGDILLKYYHYYKLYKAILQRYPSARETLIELMKKQKFAAALQKIMIAEAASLDNVNRLDMYIDQICSLPRRLSELLRQYLKHIEKETKEYENTTKVFSMFADIQDASETSLDKISQFQECWRIQNMIEPKIEIIGENAQLQRTLIKEGSLNKISRKSGALIQRHLILLSDMLLICALDRLKKKYICKYNVKSSDLTIVENPDADNDRLFRITCPSQNNEFVLDDVKEKEAWMKAFRKLPEIKFDEHFATNEIKTMLRIGEVAPVWVKDSSQTYCLMCKTGFTAIKRRHHCRTCGKIYCSDCCNFYTYVKFDNYRNKQRVCKVCFFALEKDPPISTASSSSTSASSVISNNNASGAPAGTGTSTNFIDAWKDAASAKLTEFRDNFITIKQVYSNQAKSVSPSETAQPVTSDRSTITTLTQSMAPTMNYVSEMDSLSIDTQDSDEDEDVGDVNGHQTASKTSGHIDLDENEDGDDDTTPTKVTITTTTTNRKQPELKIKFTKNMSDTHIGSTVKRVHVLHHSYHHSHHHNHTASSSVEVLFSDTILVSKLNKSLQQIQSAPTWDKQYVQLMNNNTIEIYTTQTDRIPNSIVYLVNFSVDLVNESNVIELKLKNFDDGEVEANGGDRKRSTTSDTLLPPPIVKPRTRKSMSSIGTATRDDDESGLNDGGGVEGESDGNGVVQNKNKFIKNRFSIFENTNYQLKFHSFASRQKFYNFIINKHC